MRTALLRYCLPVIVSALPSLSIASLAYSVKTEGAQVYRTEKLDPPPMASLAQGQSVKLISRGDAGSLIETEGGVKGWMRNADLLAMRSVRGANHKLGDQQVTGGEPVLGATILDLAPPKVTIDELDRSFNSDIVEPMDREQVEIRHDEN